MHNAGHPIHMCAQAVNEYPYGTRPAKGYMQIGATLAYLKSNRQGY